MAGRHSFPDWRNLPNLYLAEYIQEFFGFSDFRAGNRVEWVVFAGLGVGEGPFRRGLEDFFRVGWAGKRAGRRDGGSWVWASGKKPARQETAGMDRE